MTTNPSDVSARLRAQAGPASRASEYLAQTKGPHYAFLTPEQTLEWRAADLLDAQSKLLAEREWRLIDDGAPKGIPVLLWKDRTKEHYVAAFIQGGSGPGWCTPDGFEIFGATHWQPLPKPPIPTEGNDDV